MGSEKKRREAKAWSGYYDNSLIPMSQTQSVSPAASSPLAEPWQTEFKNALRDPVRILERLGLADRAEFFFGNASPAECQRNFKTLVTESFLAKIKPGDPDDPLLRQILPRFQELENPPGFTGDPVGESRTRKLPGLIQKYQGRVLLMLTPVCAAHCRYCFRREYPYEEGSAAGDALAEALGFLREAEDIREVILSGGDPLMASDAVLTRVLDELNEIPHLKTLRIHTRLPVFLPGRFTQGLLEILARVRLQKVMVLHVNHPAELDAESGRVAENLHARGWMLLSQSVLLRGVNDRSEVLVELSEKLFAQKVLPYYLHQLDAVSGSSHFEVAESDGRRILAAMRSVLPGYLIPRYVREEAGRDSKTPL